MKIRIALADDHPVLLSGIKHELAGIHTLDVVGTAGNSEALVELLDGTPCDVLVTDYAMPGGAVGDGLTLLGLLRRRYPDLKIIVFTTVENPAIIQEIVKLGVASVLNKSHDTGHLISAIHAAYAGATYLLPSARGQARPQPVPTADVRLQTLTAREMEVLRLFVSGMSINEIAAQLNRTKQTISALKIRAMRKLGIGRDADLFSFAYETGLTIAAAKPKPDA